MFNLIILIALTVSAPPPRTPPLRATPISAPRTGGMSPYPCMVGIEFVDGEPVLGLICGL